MAIRLLVSDVDGTLVDKDKKLTPATIDAVARLRAAGIGFTIISARPMSTSFDCPPESSLVRL